MNDYNWPLPPYLVTTDLMRDIDREITHWQKSGQHWCFHVLGEPGRGKSAALRQIAKSPCRYYVQVEKFAKSPRDIMNMVLSAYNRGYSGGVCRSTQTRATALRDFLSPRQTYDFNEANGTFRMQHSCLIVDEIQDAELAVLGSLQSICEAARCVLVFSGNSDTVFSGRSRQRAALAAAHSRISHTIRVPKPSKRDVELIAVAHGCEFVETTDLCFAYTASMDGDLRRLSQLLGQARIICGPKPACIHPMHIKGAAIMIAGNHTVALKRLGLTEKKMLEKEAK